MTTKTLIRHDAERHLSLCDPIMDILITKYGPCTLQPRTDYFTALCESIISQQLSTKSAAAICRRFLEYYCSALTPQSILDTSSDDLRSLGLSSQKVTYMRDLAHKFTCRDITPEKFAETADKAIVEQLVSVKGIGVWTAQMFLIFALNRPNVLPVDDLGIRKAVSTQYNLPDLADKFSIEPIAKPWHPYCTVASWYLWRSLENK